jgi:hypothetical protein
MIPLLSRLALAALLLLWAAPHALAQQSSAAERLEILSSTLTQSGYTAQAPDGFSSARAGSRVTRDVTVEPGRHYVVLIAGDRNTIDLEASWTGQGVSDSAYELGDVAHLEGHFRRRETVRIEVDMLHCAEAAGCHVGIALYAVPMADPPAARVGSRFMLTEGPAVERRLSWGEALWTLRPTRTDSVTVEIETTYPFWAGIFVQTADGDDVDVTLGESVRLEGGRHTLRQTILARQGEKYGVWIESDDERDDRFYTIRAVRGGGRAAQAGPVRAQPIRAGVTVTGVLSAGSPLVTGANRRYVEYSFRGRAGEQVVIDMRSSDFDAYLYLGRLVNGAWLQLASNDDGGTGTDARISHRLDADGEYLIRASQFSTSRMGRFTLGLETFTAPRPIAAGAAVAGTLSSQAPTMPGESRRYVEYVYRGRAGERVVIDLRSRDFDAYLYLGRREGAQWRQLAHDDDGGEGRDARITHVFAADGEYLIRASSFTAGRSGSFTLQVASGRANAIRVGQQVTGRLVASDPVASGRGHYQDFVFSGNRGSRVVIDLMSSDFDAYLQVGHLVNGVFTVLATDDDGGSGTDARLNFTLPSTGEFVIRATTYASGRTGAYTIRLR